MANLHASTTEHIARSHQHWVANARRARDRFVKRTRNSARWLLESHLIEQRFESIAIFGQVNRIETSTDERHASLRETMREIQRCLPTKLHDRANDSPTAISAINAAAIQPLDHIEHILKREWFKEQEIACVIICRNRFRIRVDHHAFKAHRLTGKRGLAAAVIELDALTDAVGSTAKNHDLLVVGHANLIVKHWLAIDGVGRFVGRVVVRRGGFELSRASVDELVHRLDAETLSSRANGENRLGRDRTEIEIRQLRIAVAKAFRFNEGVARKCFKRGELTERVFKRDQLAELFQEPRIDLRQLVHAINTPTHLQRIAHEIQASLRRNGKFARECVFRNRPHNLRTISRLQA